MLRLCTPRSSRNKVLWQIGHVRHDTDCGRLGKTRQPCCALEFARAGTMLDLEAWDWKLLTIAATLPPTTGRALRSAVFPGLPLLLTVDPAEQPLSESLRTASLATDALSVSACEFLVCWSMLGGVVAGELELTGWKKANAAFTVYQFCWVCCDISDYSQISSLICKDKSIQFCL